ncbi:type II toxin-antitoxin system RelE/ParE family toxin (plasmid) [Priestia flexa]|uniref:type II toxin-antitoxin system RelE/ParE family toxin n=1 Tax=Priestia flexa TaxID=86664 RepID=UPI00240D5F64|nr:type II toxin-antitoxin system RelE/ParE family toxin [Priestia flexa]WEZ10424.1 type II toxin-antitoxin system RelE/ParE family toxin [Priestia flexa]
MNYEVIFYEDNRGRSPVRELFDELQQKAETDKQAKQLFAKIFLYIEVLEQSGTRAGLPFTRYIGDGIWELRPKDHRILFFGWHENKIVLLHSFRKQTQKTPIQEIKKAKKEMEDWLKNGDHRITG